ncbi:hypothetical protein JCM19235_3835 [Vibrio maritimus]|uniref:Uncharacterized protein n=1 Tax=Vibrio maritimus TaxID=990268 RepID=A0A090S1Z3_9VIBR|nr:hypothetical protein JCM19235_3835 [Vibrio maritimus]
MAYLPFYHTPEEFDVLQEEKENHIRTGKNIHEWSCHNLEKSNRYDAVQFTILSLIPVAIMMGFVATLDTLK